MSEKPPQNQNNWVHWLVFTSLMFVYFLQGYFTGTIMTGSRFKMGSTHVSHEKVLELMIISGAAVALTPLLYLKNKHPEAKWISPMFLAGIGAIFCYFFYVVFNNSQI